MKFKRYVPPTLEEIHGADKIYEYIYKYDGKLYLVAKALGCAHTTVYSFVDQDLEAQKLVEDARRIAKEKNLDKCETQLEKLVRRMEDAPTASLNAIKYYLDNHGSKRGWGERNNNITDQAADKLTDHYEKEAERHGINDAE